MNYFPRKKKSTEIKKKKKRSIMTKEKKIQSQ